MALCNIIVCLKTPTSTNAYLCGLHGSIASLCAIGSSASSDYCVSTADQAAVACVWFCFVSKQYLCNTTTLHEHVLFRKVANSADALISLLLSFTAISRPMGMAISMDILLHHGHKLHYRLSLACMIQLPDIIIACCVGMCIRACVHTVVFRSC